MSNIYQKLIDRVTDNYNREANSNIAKIMRLAAQHIQENEDLLQRISDWRSIDNAEGVTLDYIGRNVGQDREDVADDVFKSLIKARIIKNNADGSIPTIIRFLAFILGVEKNAVKVVERWNEGDPVGVRIEISIEDFVKLGISIDGFTDILNAIMPAGVNADIIYLGSFMFADQYDQEQTDDNAHGFGEAVTGEIYNQGDFIFGNIQLLNFTKESNGFSNTEIDNIGGRFGAYYKAAGWNDGTNEKYKTW